MGLSGFGHATGSSLNTRHRRHRMRNSVRMCRDTIETSHDQKDPEFTRLNLAQGDC